VLISALGLTTSCGQSEADRLAAESAAAAQASSVAAASSSSVAAVRSSAVSQAAAAASSAAAAQSAAAASRSSAAAAQRSAEQSRAAAAAAAAQASADAAAASAAAAAADAAAADGTGPADPDTPGEDGGARCAGYEQYADEQPTGMRADAAAAWSAADAAAAAAGVTMCLADGKRSRSQQQATYDEYVAEFGADMAAQYVLPPDKSAHVLGLAVDVQPYAGYTWLEGTRGALGFCRTYDNEAWHFEFDQQFVTAGCPARQPHP
jgi:LAS superfamily LD-carboxypeptidase LdcB